MATIQKRKNGNGTTSYKVMIRPNDGLPPTYKTFPTLQEAKDWALKEEAKRRQGLYFPEQAKKKHTLSELIDRYIELVLPSKPKNAKDTHRQLMWWKEKIGGYQLNHVTSDLIAQHRKELLDGVTPRGNKRSSSTVNRYLAAISTVLTYGVKECEWINSNPVFRVHKLKEPKGRDRILSPEECKRLLNACKNNLNKFLLPFVMIALTTGARKGEIISLTWDCVDLERGVIQLKDTKSGKPRSLNLVGQAHDLLMTLHAERILCDIRVFPSKTRFGNLDLKKPWERALKEAQIEGFRIHDLRHTFATFASQAGASNLELACAMGHSTLNMLLRYTNLDASHVRRLSEHVSNTLIERVNENC